jgi:hypothetical protein
MLLLVVNMLKHSAVSVCPASNSIILDSLDIVTVVALPQGKRRQRVVEEYYDSSVIVTTDNHGYQQYCLDQLVVDATKFPCEIPQGCNEMQGSTTSELGRQLDGVGRLDV